MSDGCPEEAAAARLSGGIGRPAEVADRDRIVVARLLFVPGHGVLTPAARRLARTEEKVSAAPQQRPARPGNPVRAARELSFDELVTGRGRHRDAREPAPPPSALRRFALRARLVQTPARLVQPPPRLAQTPPRLVQPPPRLAQTPARLAQPQSRPSARGAAR